MKTSCIRHPESTRYIQLHEWQTHFCQKNYPAAMLLSHFSCWHDWKIHNDDYYRRSNDIAEAHGDGRTGNENAYLFFTMEDLINALMGLFGKKSISDGLDLLVSLGVITVHKNPNPRYHFDKTKYFKFYPDVCNEWLLENYPLNKKSQSDTQVIDYSDNAKMEDRLAKNSRPSSENSQPSRKNGQAITDTTNNTTNKNQSINPREDFFVESNNTIAEFEKSSREAIQPIVDALIEKGMPANKFYPDALGILDELHVAGATVEIFLQGYDMAARVTQDRGFGVKYLAKVVEGMMKKPKHHTRHQGIRSDKSGDPVYKNDFSGGLSWMGDLVTEAEGGK